MIDKCKCGGNIRGVATAIDKEKIYENLYCCIDCDRRYLLKENKFKPISHAEFRRIARSREAL